MARGKSAAKKAAAAAKQQSVAKQEAVESMLSLSAAAAANPESSEAFLERQLLTNAAVVTAANDLPSEPVGAESSEPVTSEPLTVTEDGWLQVYGVDKNTRVYYETGEERFRGTFFKTFGGGPEGGYVVVPGPSLSVVFVSREPFARSARLLTQ